jgi:ketosteroid isomerase-like protein
VPLFAGNSLSCLPAETPESLRGASRQELANHQQARAAAPPQYETDAELAELTAGGGGRETEEQRGKFLVLRLYEALNARDARGAQELLAPDLEWWFHGPPAHQHMMRLLTGADTDAQFTFAPRSVDAFGSTVIAEGGDAAAGQLYWVHAWTVGPDGVITQLREYFNTDLTVTRLSVAAAVSKNASTSVSPGHASSSSSTSASSAPSSPAPTPKWPKCLWQSRRANRARKSLPGLVLAI